MDSRGIHIRFQAKEIFVFCEESRESKSPPFTSFFCILDHFVGLSSKFLNKQRISNVKLKTIIPKYLTYNSVLMRFVLRMLPCKRTIHLTIAVLLLLIVFDFYGLYTNHFYFSKADNYIFPVISLIHFVYLYVLNFKIEEDELTDPMMRNIEYALYGVFLIYLFKTSEILGTLTTYDDYSNHLIPDTFLPLGIGIFLLHLLLLVLTLMSIHYRRELVGEYKFDDMNQHIDSWE